MSNFQLFIILGFICLALLVHTGIHITDYRAYTQKKALQIQSYPDNKDDNIIGGSFDRIFWFLQVSDLHISKFYDPDRSKDLIKFASFYVPTLNPDLVIVSGDITDAKLANRANSMQLTEEWIAYNKIIAQSGVLNNTMWLDLRGNHDAFNVPSLDHSENYHRQFSVQGKKYAQSYIVNRRKSFGTYTFVALDACPSPGLKRPFNFFGLITTDLANMLNVFTNKATASNHTFWFGHYPTSTIVSPGYDLRNQISKTAYAYLCGHLHTMLNYAPKMYTVQPQGFFELELADWRDSRSFRIVAVDNDLVSFVDTRLTKNESSDWPIVIITNPKDAAFLLPNKEPSSRIRKSTHIRILAWSKWPIKKVLVSINEQQLGEAVLAVYPSSSKNASTKKHPLFVLPWDPSTWINEAPMKGHSAHLIKVVCEDTNGNKRSVEQYFTLDGTTRWNFARFQSFLLLGDHTTHVVLLFYGIWLSLFIPITWIRLLGHSKLYIYLSNGNRFLFGFCEIIQFDKIFFPLFCYLLYVLCGPIFMGFLLDEHFGFTFSFGVFVNNTFIPESITYLNEAIQQIFFTFPLLMVLVLRRNSRSDALTPFISICVLMILQTIFCLLEVLFPYGWTAFLLSPGRLWLVLLAWRLYTLICRLDVVVTSREYAIPVF